MSNRSGSNHCDQLLISEIPKRGRSKLGARLRGRTATQRSKKGSEKVLGRVPGKGPEKGFEKGPAMGFLVKKGSEKGF